MVVVGEEVEMEAVLLLVELLVVQKGMVAEQEGQEGDILIIMLGGQEVVGQVILEMEVVEHMEIAMVVEEMVVVVGEEVVLLIHQIVVVAVVLDFMVKVHQELNPARRVNRGLVEVVEPMVLLVIIVLMVVSVEAEEVQMMMILILAQVVMEMVEKVV
mgnify:CR=1 FL=1